MEKKWALITGASSGIGREFARLLSTNDYSLILVARRLERLEDLKEELEYNSQDEDFECRVIQKDLRGVYALNELYDETKDLNIDILINNSGFGDHGEFVDTDLQKEMDMIDVNIKAMHVLTKKYLRDFVKKDSGYILNVSSSAGLMPAGPYMATYYASKAYSTSLTSGIAAELRKRKSNVYIGALCPGPVDTEFNDVANCKFSIGGISPRFCAKYALEKMFSRKEIIIPSVKMQIAAKVGKVAPRKLVIDICGRQQKRKNGEV